MQKEHQSVMGRTLMLLRKAHNLTQEQVANILKIKRSTYAYYERDITPTIENIKKLATLFNVTVHFLMYGKEEDIIDLSPTLRGTDEELVTMKLKDISKDEALLLAYYKLLSSQNKDKIQKEIKELADKSN